MKIVIISPSLNTANNVSGISSVVSNIIANVEHDYIHFEFGSLDKDLKSNKLMKFIRLLPRLKAFRTVLKKEHPDIVHLNVPCDAKGIIREYCILKIAREYTKSTVVHLHGGKYLMTKPGNILLHHCLDYILKKGNSIVVLSQIEQETLKKYYGINQIHVLCNSVNLADFYINRSFCEKKLHILYIGRIEYNKGIREIIDACDILRKKNYLFKFIVCGEGIDKDVFITEMRDILGDDLEYKGVVSGGEKIDVIKSADVFLLPSYFEGLPMALLETMAAGVIPVITPVGAIPTVVKDSINGLIVEAHNSEDVVQKITALIDNPSLRKTLSGNARKTIEDKFSMPEFVRRLKNIYQKIKFND